jgi:ACR3 family arsenite efflux pump ArsB
MISAYITLGLIVMAINIYAIKVSPKHSLNLFRKHFYATCLVVMFNAILWPVLVYRLCAFLRK